MTYSEDRRKATARSPVRVTRDDLYDLVWAKSMQQLAVIYGISNGAFADICRRLEVPFPSRAFWQKLAAGQRVRRLTMGPPGAGIATSTIITPTGVVSPPTELPEHVLRDPEAAREWARSIKIPERLDQPHQALRLILDGYYEEKWPDLGKREVHITDAVLKALDALGFGVSDIARWRPIRVQRSAPIQFRIRELAVQRTLKEWERGPPIRSGRIWKSRMVATGRLVIRIESHHFPPGLPRRWAETRGRVLEDLLPDFIASLVAADQMLGGARKRLEQQR